MPSRTCGRAVGAWPCAGALVALLGGFGPQPAFAQESQAVTVDVGRCTALTSPDARLACFGAQVDAVLNERSPTEGDQHATVTEANGVAQAAPSGDERSSPEEERAARGTKRGSDDPRSEEAVGESREDDEYTGTIVAIRERLPNAYVITLDNGQVWQQTEPKQYPLRPGLEVRIYRTGWGDYYRLNGLGTGGHIQVRKVQ